MFLTLANQLGLPDAVFLLHPIEIADYLERCWSTGVTLVNTPLVPPPNPPNPPNTPNPLLAARPLSRTAFRPNRVSPRSLVPIPLVPVPPDEWPLWHHLIFAYMIENTRVYEIFERIVFEFSCGERLGFPSQASQRWLRNAEELFYRHHPSFVAYNQTSYVRPDIRATRRNAYYRMFGLDLNHGTSDNRPYVFDKASLANREFAQIFEELLREAWLGYVNRANAIGVDPTDDAKIARLAEQLQQMLLLRRGGNNATYQGNLSKEEFFAVCTMEWFLLTLSIDSAIVIDLQAQATSPQGRLRKISERVGLPIHARAENYFHLAIPMSAVLTAIERGVGTTIPTAGVFYAGALQPDILAIITHWSLATGRNLKVSDMAKEPVPVGAR